MIALLRTAVILLTPTVIFDCVVALSRAVRVEEEFCKAIRFSSSAVCRFLIASRQVCIRLVVEAFPNDAFAETLSGFARVASRVVFAGRGCSVNVLISSGVAGAVEIGTSGIRISGRGAITFVRSTFSAGTGSIVTTSVVCALAEVAISSTTIVTKSAQTVEDTEIGLCCLYIELK